MSKETEALLDSIRLSLWYKSPDVFFKDITGFNPNTVQKNILNSLTDLSNSRYLICSASGVGKTFTLSNIALWSTTVLPHFIKRPYKTLIVSGSLPQAQVLYEYSRKFLRASDIIYRQIHGEPIKSRTEFKTGSNIKAVARSLTSYYGEHPDLLIIDEAVLAGDEIINDGLSRVAPAKQSRIILSSTPYESMSLFVDMWERKDRYPNWLRYSWKTTECPWISTDSIEEARKSLSTPEYQIKWEGIPSALLGSIYPRDHLKECRLEEKPIMSSGPTSMGIDWGFSPHPSALEIVQDGGEYKYHLHEEVKKGMSIDKLHELIDRLVDQYKVSTIIADASHIFENQRLQKRLGPKGVRIILVPFKGEKSRLIEQLRALIEQHRIKIWEHEIDLIHELMNYTYDTKRNDDRVDALMLACSIYRDTISSKPAMTYRKLKYR